MTDLELYKHFNKYVYKVQKDGTCFVIYREYKDFVNGLPINDVKDGFNSFIAYDGNLCFDINDVSHFFNDFEKFKKTLMKEKNYD